MAENSSNLERNMDIQVHEAQDSPNYINSKQVAQRYIMI
jgi:hypothetical protein